MATSSWASMTPAAQAKVTAAFSPAAQAQVGGAVTKSGQIVRAGGTVVGQAPATDVQASAIPPITPSVTTPSATPSLPVPPSPTAVDTTNITAQLKTLQDQLNQAKELGYQGNEQIATDNSGQPISKLAKAFQDYQTQLMTPPKTEDLYARTQLETGVQQKQSLVNQYQNQLNAITSKAQADILGLTGQGRGVPEAIIGGQQAQINKEAAIASLPVAAQLAAAQGDYKLAQEHADTLFKIRLEDAQNEYNYKTKLAESVYNFADKEQQQRLDNLKIKNSQDFTLLSNQLNQVQSLIPLANANGRADLSAALMKLDPKSPTYMVDASKIAAQIPSLESQYKQAQINALNAKTGTSVTGTAGEYTPIDTSMIKDKNAGNAAWGGLSYNGLLNAASLYNAQNGKMPSLGLGANGNVQKARTAVINYAGQLSDSLGLNTAQVSAMYKANAKAASDVIGRVAKIDAVSNALANQFPRMAELANKVGNLGITQADLTKSKTEIMSKFGSTDAASYIELIKTIQADYAALQAATAGSRGGQFFSMNAAEAIPVGLTADQYLAIQNTIQISAANALKGTQDTADELINQLGTTPTSTLSPNLTNQFDNLFKQYGGK